MVSFVFVALIFSSLIGQIFAARFGSTNGFLTRVLATSCAITLSVIPLEINNDPIFLPKTLVVHADSTGKVIFLMILNSFN
jgi:hypothetical protein